VYLSCGEWVERFKADYFDRGGTQVTWKAEYDKVLRHLPPHEPLTGELLHELVLSSQVNTRTRVRYCMVAGRIAQFAGIDYDPKPYRGKPKTKQRRTIPSDQAIVETWKSIKNPAWRWVMGMMATFGLRNHEVFLIDFDSLSQGDSVIQVLGGKTGSRLVWAFHPEWFIAFDLQSVRLPQIDLDRDHEALGHSVTEYLGEKLDFAPYDLRHAYAVRTLSYGVDLTISARYMGHSREVHERVYRHWIDRVLLQREHDRVMKKGDRPSAPLP